jgi:ABC-type antimicrobial peptide transport system permease subunit
VKAWESDPQGPPRGAPLFLSQTGRRAFLRQGATLTATGIGLGLLGALALTRALASLLYGVSARDPLTFAGIAALLAGISLFASWLPARRAARVDPIVAIRSE